MYGVCHAAIVSCGFSPALGFIHTGKLLSFVYDVADLYKTDVLVPAAFRTAAESPMGVERRVRRELRARILETGLLERVAEDLLSLFAGLGFPEMDLEEEDPSRPGSLWDPDGEVEGGVAYGGDRPGESAAGTPG